MLKRKPVQGPLYSFFGGKQSSDDKEINTASETPASTKRTCKYQEAWKDKKGWGLKERKTKCSAFFVENSRIGKTCNTPWGSEQIISKQKAWKHISWGQWGTCFDQRSRKWDFFLTQHIKLYIQNFCVLSSHGCVHCKERMVCPLETHYMYMNNHACKEFCISYLSYL